MTLPIETAECRHAWTSPGHRLEIIFTVDYWQGLTDGLVRCPDCTQTVVLNVIDWRGPRLEERIYSVSQLPEAAVTVFLRNMKSDYCDLTRHQQEVDALLATREAPKHVICAHLPELTVTGYLVVQDRVPEVTDWRDTIPRGESWWPPFAG